MVPYGRGTPSSGGGAGPRIAALAPASVGAPTGATGGASRRVVTEELINSLNDGGHPGPTAARAETHRPASTLGFGLESQLPLRPGRLGY